MTIKKLYTNLYTFVDNIVKLSNVDKTKREMWLLSDLKI